MLPFPGALDATPLAVQCAGEQPVESLFDLGKRHIVLATRKLGILVTAQPVGDDVEQVFDSYSVDTDFVDGAALKVQLPDDLTVAGRIGIRIWRQHERNQTRQQPAIVVFLVGMRGDAVKRVIFGQGVLHVVLLMCDMNYYITTVAHAYFPRITSIPITNNKGDWQMETKW